MIPSMRSSGSQGPGTEEVQSEDFPERGPPGTRDLHTQHKVHGDQDGEAGGVSSAVDLQLRGSQYKSHN